MNRSLYKKIIKIMKSQYIKHDLLKVCHKLSVDYEEMYFPIMNAIMFWYLISLKISEWINMHVMDVFTTYLYGS